MEDSKRVFTGVWIPKAIYKNKEAKWIEKILFLEIHSFTSNGKECYFSNEHISAFLGVSPRQVTRVITSLKVLGWISETSFDGRKRYLKSNLNIDFQIGESEKTQVTSQDTDSFPSSLDTNVQHNIPVNKPINSSFKKKTEDLPKKTIVERGKALNE
jgi:hypothetical protein